jgi:hypothetical protein
MRRDAGGQPVERSPASAMFWRVFVLIGLVFVIGAAVLVVSPATCRLRSR